jgi:hypothetical protein
MVGSIARVVEGFSTVHSLERWADYADVGEPMKGAGFQNGVNAPVDRTHLRRIHREDGMTIFLTTNYIEDAEIDDRIALIRHGRLLFMGFP